jgi:hypothetical protein
MAVTVQAGSGSITPTVLAWQVQLVHNAGAPEHLP